MSQFIALLSALGHGVRSYVSGLGRGARLFVRLVALGRENLRRFSLVRDQIHFLGNYSLAIMRCRACSLALCSACRATTP